MLAIDSCTADSVENECYSTNVTADIYYIGDDTKYFQARLTAAIKQANLDGLFLAIPGVVGINGMSGDSVHAAGASSATGTTDNKVSSGAIAAVSLSGLGLILVLLLLARRRKNRGERFHYREHGDDQSCNLDGTSTMHSSDIPNRTRGVVVVDDDESVISGWTDLPGLAIVEDLAAMECESSRTRRQTGPPGAYGASSWDTHQRSTDVHICKSALCESCELKRQSGPLFLPVGNPTSIRETVPSHATRVYSTHDTVDL